MKFQQRLEKLGFSSYAEYLRSPHWKAMREKYIATSKYKGRKLRNKCAICGTRENLDLHHTTYLRLGWESLKDLIFLCRTHHYQLHQLPPQKSPPFKSRVNVLRAIYKKEKWLKKQEHENLNN